MVIGYRMADGAVFWGRSPMLSGINNLLVLFSIYIFAADGMKTRAKGWFRNPQLTAFKIWAFAHLIPNGDVESFILFGGLLAWAVVEMLLINRRDGARDKPPPAPRRNDVLLVIAGIAVYVVVAAAHQWLFGFPPFI